MMPHDLGLSLGGEFCWPKTGDFFLATIPLSDGAILSNQDDTIPGVFYQSAVFSLTLAQSPFNFDTISNVNKHSPGTKHFPLSIFFRRGLKQRFDNIPRPGY